MGCDIKVQLTVWTDHFATNVGVWGYQFGLWKSVVDLEYGDFNDHRPTINHQSIAVFIESRDTQDIESIRLVGGIPNELEGMLKPIASGSVSMLVYRWVMGSGPRDCCSQSLFAEFHFRFRSGSMSVSHFKPRSHQEHSSHPSSRQSQLCISPPSTRMRTTQKYATHHTKADAPNQRSVSPILV